MEVPKPESPALNCARNCAQVAYILRNKTRPDREKLAEDQLREAHKVINGLLRELGQEFDWCDP